MTVLVLAAQAAMGLTGLHLQQPATLSDVRLFAMGRYFLWKEWDRLSEDDRRRIALFARLRPAELSEKDSLLWAIEQVLTTAVSFAPVAQQAAASRWQRQFVVVPGADLRERIDRWLSMLEKERRQRGTRRPVSIPKHGAVELEAEHASYTIPVEHLRAIGTYRLEVQTTPHVASMGLDLAALRSRARTLDARLGVGASYEKHGVEGFLDGFTGRDGSNVTSLRAGRTQLALAPTGSGKSVSARLIALENAANGIPTALVVPDVATVRTQTMQLERAVAALGSDLRVVPLSSWRKAFQRLRLFVGQASRDDPEAEWPIRALGYSCLLSAYLDSHARSPAHGEEPCRELMQTGGADERSGAVECPFAATCGRFRSYLAAPTADILVVNHDAFLAGNVPFQVHVGKAAPAPMTVAELVLRRAAVVLVDEVDGLQEKAIESNGRALQLSSQAGLSKIIKLHNEVEDRRSDERIGPELRFERGRFSLACIMTEAERLSELVHRKELLWTERGSSMTWTEANDHEIAEALYPRVKSGPKQVRALFEKKPLADPASEALRRRLKALNPGLGDGTVMLEIRFELAETVRQHWPFPNQPAAQRRLDALLNRLIIRAILRNLDLGLAGLRPQLPGLEQHGVAQAGRLRDDLLGYSPWQLSPTGPLGQQVNGYAFPERHGERGSLETRTMGGDPHLQLRELGELVSLALAGCPRVVLGLSATCRFRGSPRADVLGEVVGAVRDSAGSIRVVAAHVQARISGSRNRSERMNSARAAGAQLWSETLRSYLHAKAADLSTRGRARALLVTNSYDEARAVAEGVRSVAGERLHVRHLVADGAEAGEVDAIARSKLESFGDVPEPAVLAAPLSVIARGHNIVQFGTGYSAVAGVFVLTRPVPPSHDAARMLSHLSYNALLVPTARRASVGETLEAERRASWRRLRALQRSPSTFRRMDPELRRELVCDVLVALDQLTGRARRGGTDADLVFVDGAFEDEHAAWRELIFDVFQWWQDDGWLDEMLFLHRSFLGALADYCGFPLARGRGRTDE